MALTKAVAGLARVMGLQSSRLALPNEKGDAEVARCKKCASYILSENRHDFVTCFCGAVSIDGGRDYTRITGNDEDYELLSVVFGYDTEEQLKQKILILSARLMPKINTELYGLLLELMQAEIELDRVRARH